MSSSASRSVPGRRPSWRTASRPATQPRRRVGPYAARHSPGSDPRAHEGGGEDDQARGASASANGAAAPPVVGPSSVTRPDDGDDRDRGVDQPGAGADPPASRAATARRRVGAASAIVARTAPTAAPAPAPAAAQPAAEVRMTGTPGASWDAGERRGPAPGQAEARPGPPARRAAGCRAGRTPPSPRPRRRAAWPARPRAPGLGGVGHDEEEHQPAQDQQLGLDHEDGQRQGVDHGLGLEQHDRQRRVALDPAGVDVGPAHELGSRRATSVTRIRPRSS